MMEEGSDSIKNTIQPPAIDCMEIINQAVKRTTEKQQQRKGQLTDMISTLTSLISFHSQQQQVPNSSTHNTPHSGVGAPTNVGDNTLLNGVAPGNQMTGLIHGGVGNLPQGDNTSVKVAPSSWEPGHGRSGTGDSLIPPHGNGGNTPPKGAAPNRSGRTGHNTPHNGVGSPHSDDCALSVQASNVIFAIDEGKRPKQINSSKDQNDQYQSRSSESARDNHPDQFLEPD